uniref:RNA-directed DNA polymerase n=1 Tax=Clastoptera arizonana TaxID=38151 RepID=A0A1B6CSL2_9HEMI
MFAKDKFDIGNVCSKEAEIKLISNEYVTARPYRCSIPDDEEIRHQIKKLLQVGIIEESDSPFASPVTLAYKKDEKKKSRLCVDYRRLNKLVVPECFPFPTIQDVIDKVVNCSYFTVLDINSAFWCINLKKQDREKTSFVTKYGKFMFKVLPFGLKNAPATFQRILSNIIRRNNLDTFCVNYIDDILLFSKSWEEHIVHIERLLEVLSAEGFKLKLIKCLFAKQSVKYLGHVISENKVSPCQENLVSIKKLVRPANKSEVRSILGSINFYLKYIENSAQKLEPFHRLLRKDIKFEWTEECERTFNMIKDHLCSTPILAIYDRHKPIIIETDASYKGIGATLKQPQDDGMLHPVSYFSRKLSNREKKFDVIHLECKAIKDSIKFWQYYLIGQKFTVCSDHKPLENLRTKARTDEILGDLIFYLSQFNFTIIYKKGKENILADLLSRNPVLEYFENDDVIKVVNLINLSSIVHDQSKHVSDMKREKQIEVKQGLIFKKHKGKARIFVSESFGNEIIKLVHQHYGHIGPSQMIATIRPHYYFKGLDKAVHIFCKGCMICVENKTRRSRSIGLLSKLGPAETPFQIMSLDSVGGFGGNRSSKRYMHILVDHFTRYAWISTTKGQDAQDFIDLVHQILKNNKISILLADQYPGINSNQFKNYLKENGVQIVFTCVDHPESNGLNERLNQTLVNRLRCKMNEKKKSMDNACTRMC